MNPRITKLREKSLQAVPSLSPERALILTEVYRSPGFANLSAPRQRSAALKAFLSRKSLYLEEDELIVGERGPAPKATPTYPEINIHSLEDLKILDSRPKIPFRVSPETFQIFQEVLIPFWKGRSQRERLFATMAPEWIAAYESGIFTEFMEQRAPGHTVLDDKIYRSGLREFQKRIRERIEGLDPLTDTEAYRKREELTAMEESAEAVILFANRYADFLEGEADRCPRQERKEELREMARICRKVPAEAPETFHEALQAYWFIHLGVICELNPWDSFNPGRLDQHLWPFYERETREGTLTKERAQELLQAFWIRFHNQPSPPKVGITAEESNTYTDFALINLGGVKEDGSDGVNELTYLILDVIEEMRLLQPSSMIQVSKKSPDRFILKALEIIKTGFGQPSVFNTDAIIQEMLRQGKSLQDARNGGASGCVETGAFGKESYILTGYFNLTKILELTLHNGRDPRRGILLGLETGNPADFRSFEDLLEAFRRQVEHFVKIKVRGSNTIERLFAEYLPAPFLSLLISDCIEKGKDYHDGGARYNTSYIQGVGLGSVTDSLTALKHHIYQEKTLTWEEFMKALDEDFEGREPLRRRLLNETPKYGNDDEEADGILREVFKIYHDAVNGRPNTRSGVFRINLLPTTCHVYFGRVTGATPDGRKSGQPLSEGISPVQGADTKGPTGVVLSASKIDHLATGGTLLNQKFTPRLLSDREGLQGVLHLIRTYFRLDGHHIQFNVVDAATLREAQKHPENHRDLIVRVAGYSDYFVDLGEDLQNEILHRTEHQGF